jgi:N-acyl-phosphatidylethanolamine-hydrolysing phospholipase D
VKDWIHNSRGVIRGLPALVSLLFVFACGTMGEPFNEKAWRLKVEGEDANMLYAPHYRKGRYFNPWLPSENRGFGTFLKWRLFGKKGSYTDEERAYLPSVVPDPLRRVESLHGKDYILWVGHATFLMRINGEYWLTDPVFSDRVVIPERKTPPAFRESVLKKLDGAVNVIISHNHYDHLDEESIRRLPPGTRFYVPMGLGGLVRGMGALDVVEMDWWQVTRSAKGSRLVCLPAQHWSRRLFQGVNRSLWAGYMIESPKTRVLYAGDSGYFIGYREIGRRFPGIDYALMPTTAYRPRWFMHYAHMDVREAIEAFRDLGARYFIPAQWGTFHLGDEPPGYPALDLRREIARQGLDASRFLVMDIGGIVTLDEKR